MHRMRALRARSGTTGLPPNRSPGFGQQWPPTVPFWGPVGCRVYPCLIVVADDQGLATKTSQRCPSCPLDVAAKSTRHPTKKTS